MKVFRTTYKNGVYFEVHFYPKPAKNVHESDRIRVILKPEHEEKLDFYMHALEAVDLISGLSLAVGRAINKEVPLFSTD